jgi:SAM-dependent methyltransferase
MRRRAHGLFVQQAWEFPAVSSRGLGPRQAITPALPRPGTPTSELLVMCHMTLRRETLRVLEFLDRFVGRGSYRPLKRWLDPKTEYTQITYGRVLDKILGPSTRWLEAGCGHEILKHGAGTEQFDLSSKPRMAVGCDIDMASLREQHVLKNRVCCNLEALSFRSGSFEVVTLNNVAEHIANPVKLFSELARVLKDNGHLVIHTPNANGYWVLISRLGRFLLPERFVFGLIKFMEHREENDVFPTVYRANTRSRLVELASGAGMTVESVSLLRHRPLFYFFAPAAVVELLSARLLTWLSMEEFASSVLLAVFRRAPAVAPSPRRE